MPRPLPFQLLHGPYYPPGLQVGARTHCLLRGCEVVITSWTDARIPWPRCQAVGQRGGCGLLLDEELARAVRCESAFLARTVRSRDRESQTATLPALSAYDEGVSGSGAQGPRRYELTNHWLAQ